MESPRSPKRRRILASINPTLETDEIAQSGYRSGRCEASAWGSPNLSPGPAPPPAPGRTRDETPAKISELSPPVDGEPHVRQTDQLRTTKFRFKSSGRRQHRSPGEDDDDHRRRHRHRERDGPGDRDRDRDGGSAREKDDKSERSSRHRRHHPRSRSRSHSPSSSTRHRHRHHRRRRHHHRDGTTTTTTTTSHPNRQGDQQSPPEIPPDPFAPDPLDPEVAFRESLFDAMADDEGAAYWEGVYGQPIHVYSSDRLNPQGELERMTDEEYAAHVRQKMWEKTHAGLLEERERRKRQAEERTRRDEENRRIQAELERSLRKGEQRRKRRVWKDRWDDYVDAWTKWDGKTVEGIPWPVAVESLGDGANGGEGRKEVDTENARAFFVNGLNLEELGEKEFAAKLKDERVRWHPDKMQQRLGGKVEEGVMRDITAIFQVIDALWNDTRKSS